MANLIQIKRSLNTSIPTSLANGELAYTANGDVLYIGSNSAVVAIGGKRVPGVLTANQALIANATSGIDKVIVANLQPTAVYANGSLGSAGEVLTSNGTAVHWATAVTSLSGLSDVDTTGAANGDILAFYNGSWVDFDVVGGTALTSTSNSTAISISLDDTAVSPSAYGDANTVATFTVDQQGRLTAAGTADIDHDALLNFASNEHVDHSTVSISSGNGLTGGGDITTTRTLSVVAGTGVTVNSTGVHIGQSVGTTDNVTFANVVSDFITINNDLAVSGNLTVTGDLVTINVSTLSVIDPLIELASNNAADTVDVGFYGNYNDGTGRFAGIFRDAGDGIFKVFANTTVEPTTTVDTGGTGYTLGTLEAYLNSGGLVSNSSAVTLTANSTVAVNLTANTLTLTTPLVGTSGGTGLSSYTAQDIIVANSTNGFDTLSLGTDGYVLQSNGSALIYSTLDGGTF